VFAGYRLFSDMSQGLFRDTRGALHFTASEVSADEITAPISPHRTSPPAKFTAFALHRLVNLRHDEFSAS